MLSRFLCFFHGLVYRADEKESGFGKIIVQAIENFAEAAYRFGKRNVCAGNTRELFRNVEGLGKETLDLSRAGNKKLIFIGKLVHTHDRNDIHKLLITLKYSLDLTRHRIMLFSENVLISVRATRKRTD